MLHFPAGTKEKMAIGQLPKKAIVTFKKAKEEHSIKMHDSLNVRINKIF